MESGARKKLIGVAVLIVIIIAVGLIYSNYTSKQPLSPQPAQQQTIQMSVADFKEVPLEKLPERFPADFPIEKGVKVLQNRSFVNPNQAAYSYRAFVSSKTLEENYDLYRTYLIKNDWVFVNDKNELDSKTIVARKGQEQISIVFRRDTTKNEVVVSITLIYFLL